MINNIYTVFDKKTGKYGNPTYHNLNKEQAIESITDAVKVGSVGNAEDLEFYYLGTFDTVKGEFTTFKPEFLLYLGDFVNNGN